LDWIIWNAPLQNLRDGDGRWRLRLSVDGDSFLVDQQEALWLKGSPSSSGNLVQMELLNGVGEPITPEFNNQLIHQSGRKTPPPTWLKARLTEDELARLSGTPLIPAEELVPEAKATPEPIEERETKPEAQPVVTAESLTASPDDDEATASPKPEASAEAEKVEESGNGVSDLMESEPEPKLKADALGDEQDSTDDSDDSTFEQAADDVSKDNSDDLAPPAEPIALDDQAPLPKSEKPSMPVPSASEERLIPTSRLGGSARELLNDDGSLRKP
jgi:hypothetical protein